MYSDDVTKIPLSQFEFDEGDKFGADQNQAILGNN